MNKNAFNFTEEDRIQVVQEYLTTKISYPKLAKKHDIGEATVKRWVAKYRGNAEYGISVGENLKGTSTLYDDKGNVKQRWVKTDADTEKTKELLSAYAEGYALELPKAKPVKAPKNFNENLMALYTLTDAHIGMRSDEWDIEESERIVTGWIDMATHQAPDAHTAVLNVQGDTAHWDSLSPVTPASGHVLDAACGSRVMARTIIKLMRYAIAKLLLKHKHVHVKYLVGNHDEYGAVMNSEWLNVFYENEPRVSVDTTDELYHCHLWGKTVNFFHHGHKRNIMNVGKVFVRMFRKEYGVAEKAYGHIGHFHHGLKMPQELVNMEIHPTLAAKDEYAKYAGYIADRAAHVIYYHKEMGECGRNTITPEMIE